MAETKTASVLSAEDRLLYQLRTGKAREVISGLLRLDWEIDGSLTGFYKEFYLQVSFSDVHPLLVLSLAKPYYVPMNINMFRTLNRINLNSILGSHTVNDDVGCYSFRATQWLFTELTGNQFRIFLERCTTEAEKGVSALLSGTAV